MTKINVIKICKKCLIFKPLEEFPAHKKMADGHLNVCKECKRKYTAEYRVNNIERKPEVIKVHNEIKRKWKKENPSKMRAYRKKYKQTLKGKETSDKATKKWQRKNSLKVKAYAKKYAQTLKGKKAYNRAHKKYKKKYPLRIIANNALYRAVRDGKIQKQLCEECGATDNIHGHHDDYDRPLGVRWLCAKCHRTLHTKNHVEEGVIRDIPF